MGTCRLSFGLQIYRRNSQKMHHVKFNPLTPKFSLKAAIYGHNNAIYFLPNLSKTLYPALISHVHLPLNSHCGISKNFENHNVYTFSHHRTKKRFDPNVFFYSFLSENSLHLKFFHNHFSHLQPAVRNL